MGKDRSCLKLDEYLTVSEAAAFLGVSGSTLRNWDKADKLKPYRHPVNGYRLYSKDDLEKILVSLKEGKIVE
jgi:MerR family transcriptional regulator, copper efflux regulator